MNVEQRLAQLERGNRRMKRIGTLVLLAAAAVLLSGAANGKDLQNLEVRSLTLKDKAGKVRARLRGSSLTLFDQDGNVLADLRACGGLAGLRLADKTGKTQVTLGAHEAVARLVLSKDGGVRASVRTGTRG